VRQRLIVLFTVAFAGLLAPAQVSRPPIKYFPDSSLDLRRDHFKRDWYSAQLNALQEPSLYQMVKVSNSESYRFLWLRTFHHPVAVRIDVKPDGTGMLTAKISTGAGGYRPGVISENRSQLLNKEQISTFLAKVDDVQFWKAPNPVNDQRGADGSQWIIEGLKNGRYHVVDRWSPTNGVTRQLGSLMAFDLAKLTIPKDEIY
jgi:hypothetical protein